MSRNWYDPCPRCGCEIWFVEMVFRPSIPAQCTQCRWERPDAVRLDIKAVFALLLALVSQRLFQKYSIRFARMMDERKAFPNRTQYAYRDGELYVIASKEIFTDPPEGGPDAD